MQIGMWDWCCLFKLVDWCYISGIIELGCVLGCDYVGVLRLYGCLRMYELWG